MSLCSDIQARYFLQITQHTIKLCGTDINGAWASSFVHKAARWHHFVCFTAGLTGILLPHGEASTPWQRLQKLLRVIKSQASVRKLPVVSFLTTAYVSLQASFLLCRFGSGITKKKCSRGTSCFQICYLYVFSVRVLYLLINKEAENGGTHFWKYWSLHMHF